ncbi:hypothetical protein TcG_07425 [Trypanosoma cruzi]|uniref:Enriched in surface-labeled proteome protein 15 n=1 Tax=Trypanosoma cruzi Dm28c TaxID=1416333 RepID=V5BKB7_TRYCR|nr:hypothetical protein TCDM_06780 [Trypanosoma cruzi Dm28c]RNF14941.1 hypothetical protein TcG_07425 [Trypanosoma cruzi]
MNYAFMEIILLLTIVAFHCRTEVLAVGVATVRPLEKSTPLWDDKSESDVLTKEPFNSKVGLKKSSQLSVLFLREDNRTLQGNVRCGGGYCPNEAPICCGEAPHFYCVPGGNKCCYAPKGKVAACEQSDECCVFGNNATCCKQGTTCQRDGNGSACAIEACTKYQTSDDCLYKTEECAWCCEERRCVSKSRVCSSGKKPIRSSETCPSPCQYADTCALCLSYNSSINGSDACFWCCATQSCNPKSRVMECNNDQEIQGLGMCSVCQANGPGINPEFVGMMSQFFAMISGIVLIVGIISCIGVTRAYFYFRGGMLTNNGMRLSDVDAQMAVRRHGFGSRETVSMQESVKRSLNRFFCKVFSIFKSKLRLENSFEAAQTSSCLGSVLSCSMCHRIQHVRILASVANTMKGIKMVEGKTGSNSNNDVNAADDDIVIMLPCCHAFCRPCVGLIPSKNPLTARLGECPLEAQPHDADTIRANYIRLHLSPEEGTSFSRGIDPSTTDTQYASREEQHGMPSFSGRREENGSNIIPTSSTSTRWQPQRRIRIWRDGLLHSLRRLVVCRESISSLEGTLLEDAVLKKINHKCPKCKQRVKDVLLPENILKL